MVSATAPPWSSTPFAVWVETVARGLSSAGSLAGGAVAETLAAFAIRESDAFFGALSSSSAVMTVDWADTVDDGPCPGSPLVVEPGAATTSVTEDGDSVAGGSDFGPGAVSDGESVVGELGDFAGAS